jgi:hypothetical protein
LWNGGFHSQGVWEKSRQPVKPIRRDRESPIQDHAQNASH